MSDPKQDQHDTDALDLDAETVKDLEPPEQEADTILGGTATCGGPHYSARCTTGV